MTSATKARQIDFEILIRNWETCAERILILTYDADSGTYLSTYVLPTESIATSAWDAANALKNRLIKDGRGGQAVREMYYADELQLGSQSDVFADREPGTCIHYRSWDAA